MTPPEMKAKVSSNDEGHQDDDAVLDPVQFLRVRRYGPGEHSDTEIRWFIEQFTKGEIPEYQMAAWLMATCFRPLSKRETATLTDCMVLSTPGGPLQWKSDKPLVDKHSTGGIGDKVSIILAPLVASFGVGVPMIAGRGLGHTGGTIDKLESIPGFNATLTMQQFQDNVQTVGCCINAAGPDLCPADRKMYALRDVTCTVECIPLQTASIMCKKIAEHPDSIILDVKYGTGAFQSTAEAAAELATSMVHTGKANGLNPTTAFLTRMSQPLGYAIGNWYEIQECLEILQGTFSEHNYDLVSLVSLQAGQMLLQSGLIKGKNLHELSQLAFERLQKGTALAKFKEMALTQGADPEGTSSLWYPSEDKLYQGIYVKAPKSGWIISTHNMQLGWMAVALGAGRRMAHESVDPYAGILLHAKIGTRVKKGDTLATLHGPSSKIHQGLVEKTAACFVIEDSDNDLERVPVVTHSVTVEEGVQQLSWDDLPSLFRSLYPTELQS